MTPSAELLPKLVLGFALVAPFVGGIALLMARHCERAWTAIACVVPVATLAAVGFLFVADTPATLSAFTLWGGLTIGFAVEPMGLIFSMLVGVLWPVSVVYSLSYLRVNNLRKRANFCAWFSVAIGSTLCIAFAADLLTMLIFYEALTLSTYPLVTHVKNDKTRRGGRVYLAYLLGTSFLFLLPAIVWIFAECSTLSFAPGGFIDECASPPRWLLLLLFVYGVGKAAMMPLHRWLPAAMVAPAPVSALLHAVAVVKSGVFVLLKSSAYVFGYDMLEDMNVDWLVYLSGVAMLLASVLALLQDNLKKVLAYSTVGQLCYIVMGAALLKSALVGAFMHMLGHAAAKIVLFFAVGAIQSVSGHSTIGAIRGIAKSMPWTMTFFVIGAASLTGIPPLSGFVSKWFLLESMVVAPHVFAIGVIILSTLLNFAYFGRIVGVACSPAAEDARPAHGEAPRVMLLAMGVPVVLVIGLPLISGFFIELLERVQ